MCLEQITHKWLRQPALTEMVSSHQADKAMPSSAGHPAVSTDADGSRTQAFPVYLIATAQECPAHPSNKRQDWEGAASSWSWATENSRKKTAEERMTVRKADTAAPFPFWRIIAHTLKMVLRTGTCILNSKRSLLFTRLCVAYLTFNFNSLLPQ